MPTFNKFPCYYDLMKQLLFSTSNNEKFLTAKHACDNAGVELQRIEIDVVEIQDENTEAVAIDKAQKAFNAAGKPLVITDESWSFDGLKGFPGVYMHSMNEWFTPEDYLRLVLPLENRDATLTQTLVYIDSHQCKVFRQQTNGKLLTEIRGKSKHSSHTIITLEGDNGLSIAEAYDSAKDKSTRQSAQV